MESLLANMEEHGGGGVKGIGIARNHSETSSVRAYYYGIYLLSASSKVSQLAFSHDLLFPVVS